MIASWPLRGRSASGPDDALSGQLIDESQEAGTSDPVLDDALNLALPVELSQTPFLQVLAQDKVRETMAQLHHPQDGKVTPEIARELGGKQG